MVSGAPWNESDVTSPNTRPGFYVNFLQGALAVLQAGVRGDVGVISEADWGDPNVVQVFESEKAARDALVGYESSTHRLYRLVRFAFLGGAQRVKAGRVMNTTGAVKATDNLNDTDGGAGTDVIRIDAKYEGTYGNNIAYDVGDDPVDGTKTRIRIYVDGQLVHNFTSTVDHGQPGFIDNIIEIFNALNSVWVTFTKLADGLNDLANVAAVTNLAGGANGDPVTVTEFNAILDEFAANTVDLLTTDSVSAAIHAAIETWVDNERTIGDRVMAILGSDTGDTATTIITDAQTFNNGAIVYVGGGIVAPNLSGVSTTYNGANTAALVAGIIAGIPANISPTYRAIPNSVSVETNFTNDQVRSMLGAGVLVIAPRAPGNPGARIEQGLTTLFNPGPNDISSFRLIRTVRVMDAIAEGIGTSIADNFIGRQLNDEDGRQALLDVVRDFLNLQVEARAVEAGYEVTLDESQQVDGALFLNLTVTPIDAVEKIFSTIRIL